MSTKTFDSTRFPEGATVAAHRVSDFPTTTFGPPRGAPSGVAVDSDTVTGGSFTLTLPAGDYWLASEVETDVWEYERFQLNADSVAVTATAGTTTEVVGAVPGRAIRVLSASMVVGGTATDVTVQSDDGVAPIDLSAPMSFGANGGIALDPSPEGHYETRRGDALIASLGAGSDVGITLTYALI